MLRASSNSMQMAYVAPCNGVRVRIAMQRRSLVKETKPAGPRIVYDKQSIQPLTFTVVSFVATASSLAFALTQPETPQEAGTLVKFLMSPVWNYLFVATGGLFLFGARMFPKYLVSEVAIDGGKAYIRVHTMLGQKTAAQEVVNIGDLMRVKSKDPNWLNLRVRNQPRRFTLASTEEIEKLFPLQHAQAQVSSTGGIQVSSVGAKSVDEVKQFEQSLKQRWSGNKQKN